MATAKAKKRRKILIFSFILVAVAGLTAYALLRKREVIVTVQTEKATLRNLTELVRANGRIHPVIYVKISPEVSGEIIELPVREGQSVQKGDLLVKIKPDVYVANRNSSEASYKAALSSKTTAEASLQRDTDEYQRLESLHRTGLVSDSIYMSAKTAYEIARAQVASATHQVEMAKAALERTEEDLRKTTIFSPLDGTVTRLNSQPGERVVGTAMMAGTEIMTIADLNEMEARVDVGEIDVVLIQTGQVARLEVDAFKDRKFSGTVTEIANSSKGMAFGVASMGGGQSQDATKFEVKVRLKDKETFRPGMTVTAEVETRYRTNVLAVPTASVTTRLPKETGRDKDKEKEKEKEKEQGKETELAKADTGSTNADLATDASQGAAHANTTHAAASSTNGTAQTAARKKPGEAPKPIEVVFVKDGDRAKMIPVKRGISDDDYTEILQGLEEGQEVVSGGFKAISRELEDGKRIKIGKTPADKEKEKEKQ